MINTPATDRLIAVLFNVAGETTPEQRIARELSIVLADLTGTLPIDKLTVNAAERLVEALKDRVAENQVLHGTVDPDGHAIA